MHLLTPDWPTPPGIRALTTTRIGGSGLASYDELNLAFHVGDSAQVARNRFRLSSELQLTQEPFWLEQIHSNRVLEVNPEAADRRADAAWTDQPGRACVVMTADCLPVLFAATDGSRVAAAHAGWRGLVDGVLEATIRAMDVAPDRLAVWLGPAIGPEHFEVGAEVRDAFLNMDPAASPAFIANSRGRWQADLYALARRRLERAGVTAIHGGGHCTHREKDLFFSHRRDNGRTGRMASLIWIE